MPVPLANCPRGQLFPVAQFNEDCDNRRIADHDGYGYVVIKDTVFTERAIRPSNRQRIPAEATSILWYGKTAGTRSDAARLVSEPR
jgi:hypothetical protein